MYRALSPQWTQKYITGVHSSALETATPARPAGLKRRSFGLG